MDPQIHSLLTNVSALLDQNRRPASRDSKKFEHISDPEPWEPPFERWLKLADHLLRDWPNPRTVRREHDAQ
ncbi:MAG: hypothetical protein DMG93_15255 [Acidobacteria bacterium]|jgi:hypothetical protein|nr:MAG: hypothetical protein DMG93_15255 [Acidobacteriota bacterium]